MALAVYQTRVWANEDLSHQGANADLSRVERESLQRNKPRTLDFNMLSLGTREALQWSEAKALHLVMSAR